MQTMPPTTPNWAAPPVDWVSQEISFPHRISRALNFGTSSEGSVGCGLRLIYENLLNEVFAPMSDVRCACAIIIMNAVQIWQSSNRKKERKKERKEREWNFWLLLLLELFLHVVGIYTAWAGDEQMANCWFSLSEMPVMCSVSCRSIRHAPELWTLSNGHTSACLPDSLTVPERVFAASPALLNSLRFLCRYAELTPLLASLSLSPSLSLAPFLA